MTKYSILLNILDVIIREADVAFSSKYNPLETDQDKINQTRSRAFIHLFLKVSFGMLDFKAREYFITDGSYDGGIDGYFINSENKTIYFIQSKFRTNQKNFEQKKIEIKEILVMDINRVLEGENTDENGNIYSGKIKQLQRDLLKIDDIARYKYQVILLANLEDIPQSKLRLLSGGFPIDVFDYQKCYDKLIFPVLSGTYFNASDLNIYVDLSNKSAGSKISYSVQTKYSSCEITVLFVPTIEIAKILSKYKNSILKYNPRSYLDLEGQKVNTAIRETIMNLKTNEFALFNNGITMLSDETYINEKIGQKFKAQLNVKNPQIINGGQTSYTLSRIYENNYEVASKIFENKEVLLKIITIINGNADTISDAKKISLIEEISTATNQQTPVITADRFSNEELHIKIQKKVFERYGLLYERKRGEFGDGIYSGYVVNDQLVERNLFFRIYYASNGMINRAVEKKLFLKEPLSSDILDKEELLDNFYFGFLCFKRLYKAKNPFQKIEKNIYGMVYAMTRLFKPINLDEYETAVSNKINDFKRDWQSFVRHVSGISKYNRTFFDQATAEVVEFFSEGKWYRSEAFEIDVMTFVDQILSGTFNPSYEPGLEIESLNRSTENGTVEQLEKLNYKLKRNLDYLEKLKLHSQELTVKLLNAETNDAKKKIAEAINFNDAKIRKSEESAQRKHLAISEIKSKIEK